MKLIPFIQKVTHATCNGSTKFFNEGVVTLRAVQLTQETNKINFDIRNYYQN